MPWREVCYMDERTRFIAAVLSGEESMTALCREFGISRRVGYKWRRRYAAEGPSGLEDRSRAPKLRVGVSASQAARVVALRCKYPRFGPKKLKRKLEQQHPEERFPAQSTIGELLRQRGLSHPRQRRRRATPTPAPLALALAPNDVWCIDFKGWFRTGDGKRCEPLTVTDAYSRYLLCAKVMGQPGYQGCRRELERLFAKYGLPRVIRSDNGAPFASVGVAGLSRLAVWWVKLGIWPERIAPGKPQQNGRHERMHQTLKAECAQPPAANLAAQQVRFDRFREFFNRERPREALRQDAPTQHYRKSERCYPARLEEVAYPPHYAVRRVRNNGQIKWRGQRIFIGEALIGELLGLLEQGNEHDTSVYFTSIPLGLIEAGARTLRRLKSVVDGAAAAPGLASPLILADAVPLQLAAPIQNQPFFAHAPTAGASVGRKTDLGSAVMSDSNAQKVLPMSPD